MTIELYEFQAEDFSKLIDQQSRLCASEMGTGKTPLFAEICREMHGPYVRQLVVGPMQVLGQWERWLNEAGLDTCIINPKDRDGSFERFMKMPNGVLLTHWESLQTRLKLCDRLQKPGLFLHVVGDEIHRIQNRKAQQTRELKRLKIPYRSALSGTPVTGAPHKYWSCLNWLKSSEFRGYWKFYETYVEYEIKYPEGYHEIGGPKNEEHLKALIRPWYVRHLKKERCCPHHPQGVMPWLPDKYWTEYWVDMDPKQRKAYNDMKKDMLAWVGQLENQPVPAPVTIAQMIRLQQFALAYAHVDDQTGKILLADPSTKADAVMQILEDNPDEAIVVFSQFNRMLDLLASRLRAAGIDYVMYTGENRSTREADKTRFTTGQARVFLGNIAAGGVGLDGLQEVSSTCIFTDRLWSPALNNQAEDRLWRGGQKNAVQIIDIIARDSVDLGRRQRLELTWGWIKALLNN